MKNQLRTDAEKIIWDSIQKVLPDEAVRQALKGKRFGRSRIFLVAIGKAAWQMAWAAEEFLGKQIKKGIVLTKYGHVKGEIPNIVCYEAGHPIPDENSFRGTQAILEMLKNMTSEDEILFLISGGGSALFEKPLVSQRELEDITRQLLACGADIIEINTIRKRLSAVKGGKFAKYCEPAQIYNVVLSDIIGDPLDMIASGPAYPDAATSEDALSIIEKYQLNCSREVLELLKIETPKKLENVETVVTGNVKELCEAAAQCCKELKYEPIILTEHLDCEARAAGRFLASIAKTNCKTKKNLAFIAGGETIVYVAGTGKGGRNQELALAAADGIAGLENVAVFSVGSDGTDGPTDAAGGYVDGNTKQILREQGIDIHQILQENNAYFALEKSKGLIITGATGTNVNDVAVILIKNGMH